MERLAFLERLRVSLPPAGALPIAAPQGGAPGGGVLADAARGKMPDRAVLPALGERELAELLAARLRESGCEVAFVATRRDAQAAVERLLSERSWTRVACSPGLRWDGIVAAWTVEARDAELGLCEAGWGVAETGAVVVSCDADVRRGYSLVPPAAGFFVPAGRIQRATADVLRALPADQRSLPSCVNFISGPSSTADLASVHVVGVHGPGEVFVWVIEDEVTAASASG